MTIPPNPSPDGYISLPITVDPNQLFTLAVADIQAQIPGWNPVEGNLDVIILEEAAQMVSAAAAIASQVPMSIFMAFGQLVGVDPILGVAATVPATFTMIDDAGYTIPAGTPLAYPLTGNTTVNFVVQSDVVIPEGETTGTGTLVCTTTGSFPNGLAPATMSLLTTFGQVASVVTTADVEGGVDAETVTAYINRLSSQLQLLTPRPILPPDFAALAASVPGVFRALAINELNPGRQVTDGVTTASSPNITSASANWSYADIGRTITDSAGHIPSGTTLLEITGSTTAVMSASATGSTTGDTFTFGDFTGVERCVAVCGIDENGDALSDETNAELASYLESLREVNFLVFTLQPTYTAIDVTVTVVAEASSNAEAIEADVQAAIQSFLDPATWGGGQLEPPVWDTTATSVRILDIAQAILGVSGVVYVAWGALQIGIHGGSLASNDVALPGDAPLPTVGTLTVSVSQTA